MRFDARRCAAGSLSLIALSAPTSVHAHHSFAMYDSTKLVDIVGTVKEFQWTNPHVILWVTQDTKPGEEPVLWTIELPTSTGNLSRMSWTKRSLVPGDRVKVEINPLRDGQRGGSFKKATIEATGKVLTASPQGTPAPSPGTDARQATASPSPAQAAAHSDHGCSASHVGRSAKPESALSWLVLAGLWIGRRQRRSRQR